MGFIDAYKRLEKLCGEMLGDDRPVSAYIDEMIDTPQGSRFVKGWDDDLKAIKHYRRVRNKIVHEPDCTEKNMCSYEDEQWLIMFYNRIMKQTDPLALYHKERRRKEEAKRKKQEQKEELQKQIAEQEKNTYVKVRKKTIKKEKNNINSVLTVIAVTLAVLLVVVLVVSRWVNKV